MKAVLFSASVAAVMADFGPDPVAKITDLISKLRDGIVEDGENEQKLYDKFGCWCEDTTAEKSRAIDLGKENISDLSNKIKQEMGEKGTVTSEIAGLKKDIANNVKSQEEATELRQKEHNDFAASRVEGEQAVAALHKATKVLDGVSSKVSMIQSSTELISIASGIKTALKMSQDTMTESDKAVVENFLNNPDSFLHEAQSFLQNPHGDYAPASNRIGGILKGMYSDFVSSMESNATEEGSSQHSFEDLMAVKKDELTSLNAALTSKNTKLGELEKSLGDNKKERRETEKLLASDEEVFAQTKASCQNKATEWANRSRVRTTELHGIDQALKILKDNAAKFSSSTGFLQIASTRDQVFNKLKKMGKKNLKVALLAVTVKTGGHFDAVIAQIHKMIKNLRDEEQDDIEVKDTCEKSMNELQADSDKYETKSARTEGEIERLEGTLKQQADLRRKTQKEIDANREELKSAQEQRTDEYNQYIKALKDDEDAVALLTKATAFMSDFYVKGQGAALVQVTQGPKTWNDDYGGRKDEGNGIVGIMQMLLDDIQKEMGESKKAEAESGAEFVEMRNAQDAQFDALSQKAATLDKVMADNEEEKTRLKTENKGLEAQKKSTEDSLKKMESETCAWIKHDFEARRDARKSEIEGLQDAISMLEGAEDEGMDAGMSDKVTA